MARLKFKTWEADACARPAAGCAATAGRATSDPPHADPTQGRQGKTEEPALPGPAARLATL